LEHDKTVQNPYYTLSVIIYKPAVAFCAHLLRKNPHTSSCYASRRNRGHLLGCCVQISTVLCL